QSLPARGASGAAAILPPEVLGKTLEWNSTTGVYEATARAGAPANGVRFILYSLGTNGQPVIPLQEIGYVDFKDESAAGTDKLHITVVVGATTFVDYTIAFSFGTTSFSYSLAGFVSDGTRRLDLSITTAGNDATSSVDIRFDLNAENAHIRLTETVVTLSASSFRLTADTRIQLGSEVIATSGNATITVSGTSYSVTGTYTVTANGRDYATITQSGEGRQGESRGTPVEHVHEAVVAALRRHPPTPRQDRACARAVDRATIHRHPAADLSQPVLGLRRNGAVGTRADVEQQVRTHTGGPHQIVN